MFLLIVVSLAVYNPRHTQNGLATHFWAAYPAPLTDQLRNTLIDYVMFNTQKSDDRVNREA